MVGFRINKNFLLHSKVMVKDPNWLIVVFCQLLALLLTLYINYSNSKFLNPSLSHLYFLIIS